MGNKEDFMRALLSCNEQDDDVESTATPEEIKAAGMLYLEENEFELGDLITWKDKGMVDRRYPHFGKPAVVIDRAIGHATETGTGGGNHDHEPIEIRIGVLTADGDFNCYWVDANRFKPYTE